MLFVLLPLLLQTIYLIIYIILHYTTADIRSLATSIQIQHNTVLIFYSLGNVVSQLIIFGIIYNYFLHSAQHFCFGILTIKLSGKYNGVEECAYIIVPSLSHCMLSNYTHSWLSWCYIPALFVLDCSRFTLLFGNIFVSWRIPLYVFVARVLVRLMHSGLSSLTKSSSILLRHTSSMRQWKK